MADYSIVPKEIVGYSISKLADALVLMEASMGKGQKARLSLCTEALPSEVELADMNLGMVAAGHHVSYPTTQIVEGIPTTEFVIEKGSPVFLALIPLLVPVLTLGLIAFGILRIEAIGTALMKVALVALGGVILLALVLRKPAEKYIERGGRLPLLSASIPRDIEEKVKNLWNEATKWEGIPPESKFVVFSEDNPYAREYNEAVGQLLRFKQFETRRWQPATISKAKKALAVR